MQKQLFFLISSYLIIYSFSAETDACKSHEDDTTCKADTTNNCEWTETTASCAAATCTGLEENPSKAIASCKWDITCQNAAACSTWSVSSEPTYANSGYYSSSAPTCSTVDCTSLQATEKACVASKGCTFTAAGGTCAKKGTTTSGDNSDNNSNSGFGLKTSLI